MGYVRGLTGEVNLNSWKYEEVDISFEKIIFSNCSSGRDLPLRDDTDR
jgi:hypothetical protein